MSFVRVATYAVQPGNTTELVRRVDETLVPKYREQAWIRVAVGRRCWGLHRVDLTLGLRPARP